MLKEMAKTIFALSELTLLQVNDLIYKSDFENDMLIPLLQRGSIQETLTTVMGMKNYTLKKDIEIRCDLSDIQKNYPLMVFDKRRL